MKTLYTLLFFLFTSMHIMAQSPIFEEEINLENWELEEILMPPSPLSTQVIFIGGHNIVQTTATYGNPAGRAIAKEWHDFIGFTPDDSGESLGWVGVNHEQIYNDDKIGDGGGMTAFRITKDSEGQIEVMEQTLDDGRVGHFFNVDFANTVGETGMNCGGIVGPNGRIWTAEEWYRTSNSSIWNSSARTSSLPYLVAGLSASFGVRDTSDFIVNAPEFPIIDGMTIEKYENFNYMTEVDLKSAKAIRKQYNWGRAGWEGGVISNDGKYVYLGIDATPAPWVRFEADSPFDFTAGTLTVYKEDNEEGSRWIEVPETIENYLGGIIEFSLSVGATMYVRNEWVTIDRETGIIYWTETGRDSGSSGPGILFNAVAAEGSISQPGSHHFDIATERGLDSPFNDEYQDYYGRVLYYDPSTEEVGVVVNGGPYLETDPAVEDYPAKHLSNPDGLSTLNIGGETFLMIQEDLNGSSFGRTPDGISNRVCELYILPASARDASIDDLTRITAIPKGAEITGAIQIDDNTILINSQHPNQNNPFPYNHSVTVAIHGWENVSVNINEVEGQLESGFRIYPNPTTRELNLNKEIDFAIYNFQGQRVKVYRNVKQADVSDLTPGSYFIRLENGEAYKFIVQ